MTDSFVAEVIKNINDMSTGLDQNPMIVNTRESVLTGIKKFQISSSEQAKLYANFEVQFSVAVVTKLIDSIFQSSTIEKQIAKLDAEIALVNSNKSLVDAQKLNQDKQRLDIMAGINIKNEQALSTRQSAKFEEARRHVLISSTLFNNQIQKSKEENSTLNALAVDSSFVVSESHLTRVKAALDGITLTPVTYTEELISNVGIVDAGV